MYKRDNIWWFSFVDDNGKQQFRSTGTSDRKLAEKIVAKFKVLRVEGKWFDFEKSGKIEDYLKYKGIKYSGWCKNASDNSKRYCDQGTSVR